MLTKLSLIILFTLINLAQLQNLRVSATSSASNQSSSQIPSILLSANKSSTSSASNSISEVVGDVQLAHHIPSTFIVGEIFQFYGKVNTTRLSTYLRSKRTNTKVYELNIELTNKVTGEKTICSKTMPVTQTRFIHQCLFSVPG